MSASYIPPEGREHECTGVGARRFSKTTKLAFMLNFIPADEIAYKLGVETTLVNRARRRGYWLTAFELALNTVIADWAERQKELTAHKQAKSLHD